MFIVSNVRYPEFVDKQAYLLIFVLGKWSGLRTFQNGAPDNEKICCCNKFCKMFVGAIVGTKKICAPTIRAVTDLFFQSIVNV